MKIYLANQSKQSLGGGWTFMQNLKTVLKDKVEFVDNAWDCDIYFISGATMVNRDEVKAAKEEGKKIVLRVDNIPRNSRNRNTGTTRLYDFAQLADHVVFQSEWAKDKMLPLLDAERDEISNDNNNFLYGQGGKKQFKDWSIIYNGVNTDIFKPEGGHIVKSPDWKYYLINRLNRDNNKRLEEALDIFTDIWRENKKSKLYIIGKFSPELIDAYFDFYLGESFECLGVISSQESLAEIYRTCDTLIYPSYSDACPNVVLEARACGLSVWHSGHAGIPEIMALEDISLERMGREYYNLFKKL